jgi:hypothetical protein
MNKQIFHIIIIFFVGVSTASCVSVKEYQKAHINDEEMQLGDRKVSVYEADFHAYREGAVGGTIGNSGSGCGCN